ncbi:MAG: ATP-binding protein [Ignavibacteria bacterium]|nr:ATP-binding protein [Ignavibacteria bacterium]
MKPLFLNKLSFKLFISTFLLLVSFLSVHTYLTVKSLQEDMTKLYMRSAYNISDLIKKSTRYSMLHNKRDDIYQIIKAIGNEQGVKRIRIYNKTGVINFSTDSTEILQTVDMTAEACVVCHDRDSKKYVSSPKDSIRIFSYQNEKILGLINPIKNDRDCSTAECHAHKPTIKLLGVLDVMISMQDAEDAVRENQKNTIMASVIITIIISLFAGVFILLLVNRPLKKLQKGLKELGKGNWNYRILVRSRSELGNIALEFNEMSKKLSEAYNEIKDWSENLNYKVEEKTKELKNIYEQVVQMEKLASLGKLSATVAHELNNPLEGILTYSKLIAKKLKNDKGNESNEKIIRYLNMISEETSRCGNIVKDLLLFSKTRDDKFVESELSEVIDKCSELINHHLEINNIKLIKEYPNAPITITCNPEKIQQALLSLLINSIEAMKARGGIIEIKLTSEDKYAVIRIKDEGSGIAESDLPYIFEPFFTTKEAIKGTGLGLSVAYGIIKSHKGKIEIEHTSSNGTTFKITLPII